MKKHFSPQLVKAMICCLPAVFAGCALEPSVQARVNVTDAAPVLPTRLPKVDDANARLAKDDSDMMKVIPGTGVFVKPPTTAPAASGAKDILLNFEGADLREVVRVAMGDMLRENYTIDPRVNGTVTIHTSQAVSRAAVPAILETVLRMNGAAMVRENGVYKIGPINSALRGASTPQFGNLQPG